ncbi:NifB/NifX family molybdenum-iron cluster-binding protein [Desulforhopalus sp. 52FAK]
MSVISLADKKPLPALFANCTVENIIYLPVAPQVVGRSRFAPLTSTNIQTTTVPEALSLLERAIEDAHKPITMVAIGGAGDPLATPDITLHIIEKIKERYPELKVGIKTYGIGSQKIASQLSTAGLDYVEILVDAMRAEMVEKLYSWIRPGKKTLRISDAAPLLIEEQRNGVPALKFNEIKVCISTTLYPGYNLDTIGKIARDMGELGADAISLTPHTTPPETEILLESPTELEIQKAKDDAKEYLPLVTSLFSTDESDQEDVEKNALSLYPKPTKERPNVAVVSSSGMEVDVHLGHAGRFLIYGPREDGLNCLLESRDAPAPGSGKSRWNQVGEILKDCFVLLVASAGETPRTTLAETGLSILITDDAIEGIVDTLYSGGKKGKCKSK